MAEVRDAKLAVMSLRVGITDREEQYGGVKIADARDKVSSAIEASRDELLDLGLRNPLLNYRPSKARGVEVVDELPTEIFRILVGERKAMTFKAVPEDLGSETEQYELLAQPEEVTGDGGPAARHVDRQLQTNVPSAKLQSRLLKTNHDARVFIEEQGVSILYLALGMLHWFESSSSQEPRRAPLILIPVTLERSNVRERFRLKYLVGAELEGRGSQPQAGAPG